MDWRSPLIALAGALALLAVSPSAVAQSSADSRYCGSSGVVCVPIAGNVVFEAGVTPPVEVGVRAYFESLEGLEQLDMRATAPEYRFEARIPRNLSPEFSLFGLPGPWLNDRAVALSRVQAAQSITLRSEVGVAVTATFRYPPGTVAPPTLEASVRRSVGDRWFTPVPVANGQFNFFARRGSAYTISASPRGFGNVRVEFPAQSIAHSVIVDIDPPPRPVPQRVVLLEGREIAGSLTGSLRIPIVLAERSSTGGGTLPYTLSLRSGPGFDDAVSVWSSSVVETGRRQRIGFLRSSLRDDRQRNGTRTADLQFTGVATWLPPAPDVALTVLDDETAVTVPVLSVVGVTPAPCCNGTETMLRRLEGAPGEGWTITLELDRPAPPGGSEITVDTVADLEALDPRFPRGAAVEGVDFRPLSQRVVFLPGSRSATVRIEGIGNDRVDPERYFYLTFTDPRELVARSPTVELRIVNDEVDLSPAARPDLLPVPPLPRANALDVLANDVVVASRYAGGRLEITEGPRLGTADVDTRGTASPADDRILYTPHAGRGGQVDRLRYRLCGTLDENCIAARVDIPIRPVASPSTALLADSASGFRDVVFSGLPALPDARVEPLWRAIDPSEVVGGEVAPNTPTRFAYRWNERLPLTALDPGTGELTRTILAHLEGSPLADLDLHVAYDADANGVISDNELLCSSASTGASETCVTTIRQTATSPREVLIAVSNPGANPERYALLRGGIDGVRAAPGVTATSPTRLAEGEAFPVRLAWRADSTPLGQGAVGWLRLRNADGPSLGDVPMALRLPEAGALSSYWFAATPFALIPGVSHAPLMGSFAPHDRMFVDIAPGTAQLILSAALPPGISGSLRASLRRVPTAASGDVANIPRAPPEDAASIVRDGGNSLDIVVNAPAPGRWYVVLTAGVSSGRPVAVTVTAQTLIGTPAPVVRPGGYFNPSRSGHGLFLYPAGEDWAGLWYTYTQDGAPVWYYLQGAKPGATGIWTAPIFRSGWNGSRNHLTEVGRATITPTANDAFQFTYVLDGELGSEPFSSFGRGCPSIGGRVVDASGHWFDPSRSGTGYSVQLLPNYEFHAVFAYSARGVPRFLVAERGGVGAANDAIPLQQLRGFCPLCVRTGAPERTTVGVLRREFVDGQLSWINVDAAFTNGTPGTWVANDAVVPLGGLQGCAAN
ncbi:hypothetical protein GCM10028794_03740 [Silanimonas algicola]